MSKKRVTSPIIPDKEVIINFITGIAVAAVTDIKRNWEYCKQHEKEVKSLYEMEQNDPEGWMKYIEHIRLEKLRRGKNDGKSFTDDLTLYRRRLIAITRDLNWLDGQDLLTQSMNVNGVYIWKNTVDECRHEFGELMLV